MSDIVKEENAKKQFAHGCECYKQKMFGEAYMYFNKAAERGHQAAKSNLGLTGRGIKERAEQGSAVDQYEFAQICEQGWGVAQNQIKAQKWYYKAAMQGNKKAFQWFEKAASRGNADLQYKFAVICEKGGVDRDPVKAQKWYHKAAEQENAEAQITLGYMYLPSYETHIVAYKMFQKAIKNRHPEGEEGMKRWDSIYGSRVCESEENTSGCGCFF